jgi:hypothetical protein
MAVADGLFPIIRHAVLVGVGRRGAGDQRAESAIGSARAAQGSIGDAMAALGVEVVTENGIELVAERPIRIRVESQRATGRDDFLVGQQGIRVLGYWHSRGAGDRTGEQVYIGETAAEDVAATKGPVEIAILVAVVVVAIHMHREIRVAVGVLARAGERTAG